MAKRYAIVGDVIAESIHGQLLPGGSGAIALALCDLGGEVTLRSRIGSDPAGDSMIAALKSARIHPGNIDRIIGTTCTQARHDDGSISDWHEGVVMNKGGVMDIYALFGHDALVLDLMDQPLRHFLIDLPAHTDGNVRMLTTLSHLDHLTPHAEELDVAMRCDTIVGTEAQFAILTGEPRASDALGVIFEHMPLTHLRAAVAITANGLEIIARDTRVLKPVRNAIPNLLVARVVAGIAWAMAHHAEWDLAASVALDPAAAG
jgi:hypothetical protein